MASLDIGEAVGEGFRQIGKRPLEVMVWGLVYCAVSFLPAALMAFSAVPDFIAAAGHMDAQGNWAGSPPPEFMAAMMKMQALYPLILIGGVVGRAVLFSAVFRAVLRPEEKGFCHMRLSQAELWVGLVSLVQMILAGLVMFLLMLICIPLWTPLFMAGAHENFAGWEWIPAALGVILAVAVFFWLLIRFSMALPMSFADNTFRLFESWAFTRGQVLPLLGLGIVLTLVAMAVIIILDLIFFGGLAAAFFATMHPGDGRFEQMFRQAPGTAFATLAGWFVAAVVVMAVLSGFVSTLFLAPWANAYRQLAAGRPVLPSAPQATALTA